MRSLFLVYGRVLWGRLLGTELWEGDATKASSRKTASLFSPNLASLSGCLGLSGSLFFLYRLPEKDALKRCAPSLVIDREKESQKGLDNH